MELMDDLHNSSSMLMISQLSTDQWYQSVITPWLTPALIDLCTTLIELN